MKEVESTRRLAAAIDHTFLKANTTQAEVLQGCKDAKTYGFAGVCVDLSHLATVSSELKGSLVKPICVVGFPEGTVPTSQKVKETKEALILGAQELDMVLQIEALLEKNYEMVYRDIREVVSAASGVPVKVILETSQLDLNSKIAGAVLSKAAGAHFVKTSTGMKPGGATLADVTLLRTIVGPEMGVKASGGIRSREDALRMMEAGANRIGTSAGVSIVGSP